MEKGSPQKKTRLRNVDRDRTKIVSRGRARGEGSGNIRGYGWASRSCLRPRSSFENFSAKQLGREEGGVRALSRFGRCDLRWHRPRGQEANYALWHFITMRHFPGQKHRSAPLINGKYCAQVKRGKSQGAESCNFKLVSSEATNGDGSDLSLEDPETKLSIYMLTTMTRQRRNNQLKICWT